MLYRRKRMLFAVYQTLAPVYARLTIIERVSAGRAFIRLDDLIGVGVDANESGFLGSDRSQDQCRGTRMD